MVAFFQAVIDFFAFIGDFILRTVKSLIQLFTFVAEAINFVYTAFTYMNGELVVFFVVIVVASVIYLIADR